MKGKGRGGAGGGVKGDPTSLVVRIVVVALLVGLALSWRVWLPIDRGFPLVPLVESIPVLYGVGGDALLVGLLLAGLLFLLVDPSARFPRFMITFAIILLVVEDVVRLQPWIWVYMLLLWSLPRGKRERGKGKGEGGGSEGGESSLLGRRLLLILSGLYVWSGLLKMNVAFAREVLPWFVEPFGLHAFAAEQVWLGWIAAAIEAAIGILLLMRSTRRVAAIGATALHLFIMLSLTLHGWNLIVIPWNVVMILLVWITVRLHRDDAPARHAARARIAPAHVVIVLLVWIMPLLFLVRLWDGYLSGSLYSGANTTALFFFHESDRARLPAIPRAAHYFVEGTSEEIISIDTWCSEELGVPFYPEERYYRSVGRTLCARVERGDAAGLRMAVRARVTGVERVVEEGCDMIK